MMLTPRTYHDAGTPLTTLLVSEIKMAAQIEFSIFLTSYAIFLKLCDWMRFEVNCAKSHRGVISDGLDMKI